MKKFYLFLIAIMLMCSNVHGQSLTYKIYLYDTFGDGWNGGYLDVFVNGNVVLDNIALGWGYGPAVYNLNVNPGNLLTTQFFPGGWAYECHYYIYNENNELVAQGNGSSNAIPHASYSVPVSSLVYDNDPGVCGAVVNYTILAPGNGSIVQTGGLPSGEVFPVGTITNTFELTDSLGVESDTSFTVTVEDTELPELTCQNFSVELNENDSAVVTLNDLLVSFSDNCGIDTIYMDMDTIVTCAQAGEHIVTITVEDVHGNITTCQCTVTVIDNVPPTLICPANIVVENDEGECGAVVTYGNINFSEGEILVDEVLPGSLSGWYVYNSYYNPTFSYEEITSPYNGSTAIKTSAVGTTVMNCEVDYISKIYEISGNSDVTKLKAYLEFTSNLTTYNFPYVTVELLDNDDIPLGYQVYYGYGTVGSYYNPIIAGNPQYFTELPSASGDMILDLSKIGEDIDFSKIRIIMSNYTCVGVNSIIYDHLRVINGSYNGTGSMNILASDNCPDVVVEASIPSGSFFPIGTTPVTLTATDVSGNKSTCSFTVTVTDAEAPSVSVKPLSVALMADGSYFLTDSNIDSLITGSTDNCTSFDDLNIQVFPRMFNCFHSGRSWPVQVTVTDQAGNKTVASALVTVLDTTPPVALCRDLELYLDNKGEVYISASMVETDTWNTIPLGGDLSVFIRGSYDACGIASMSVDKIKFTCSDLGENIVTLSVTDVHGNTSTCTSVVTIKDNIAPVINAVSDIVVEVLPGVCETTVTYPEIVVNDKCGATLKQTQGLGKNGKFPLGTTTETWEATDAAGNTASVSFTVTVNTTNALPVINSIADVVVNEDTPSVLVNLSGIGYGNDCKAQTVVVTADADNKTLVKTLTLNYTSGNPTGTLTMGITPDLSGTAVITVTVKDSENGMVTKTFTLTVNPVNDAPYLVKPIADQTVHASYVLKVPISSVLGVMFNDIDDASLSISVFEQGKTSLPAWATYANDTLVCKPTIADTSCVNIVVKATDGSGATASDTFKICVDGYPLSAGLLEASRLGIKMYPNPTSGKVNLEVSSGTYDMELSVMDIAGRTVLRKSFTVSERVSFDMTGKPAGMYFVKMDIEGTQYVEKLIVKD